MPTEFAAFVYKRLQEVPKGKITTYKDLAHAVGTKSYRAIGQIMRNNPYAPDVPCHRVVATNGKIGGFCGQSEGKEINRKISMLKEEGITIQNNKIHDFNQVKHIFEKLSQTI